eukprot:6198687-Pleurochrysis_carterae.AAC.2
MRTYLAPAGGLARAKKIHRSVHTTLHVAARTDSLPSPAQAQIRAPAHALSPHNVSPSFGPAACARSAVR